MLGEGVARTIAIVSIILTVASLALAVVFARKRSRIRVGFDLARALIGIGAIVVMASVTNVATPTAAIVAAVVVGAALGFAQGSALEVSPGERGFYAQRSPLGIVLWGVGIVVMQGAGMASRAGTVRVGQTIAWFSACLGIGLMVGRNGPLESAKKALAGGGMALLVAVTLPMVVFLGAETQAVAQSELTAEDLCAFAPYQTLDLDAGDGLANPQADLGPATANGVKFCGRTFGGYIEDGQRFNADVVSVYLYPSTAEATAAFDEAASALEWTMLDIGIGDRYMEIGVLGDLDFLAMGQRGPFLFQINSWFEVIPAREAMREVDANVAPFVADTAADAPTTIAPGGGETVTTIDSQPGTATTEAPTRGDRPSRTQDDDPIEPEDAAGQAVAGLIAAAAIGAITWVETGGEIGQILGGLGSGGTPSTRTRTVVISGPEAEAIINGGPGASVAIPTDQQWDENVSVPGQPPVTEGRVGSVGIVRSVGPIARGPDGTVSVSVEVDAFDPSSPPPIELDPIVDTPPEPEMVPPRPPEPDEAPPLPDIDEIYEPPPDPEPLPPRPPPADEPPPEPPPPDEPPPEPPPPDEPPPDDRLTAEDMRDPEFRRWVEEQQRFQGDLAEYYRGGTAWQWFETATETMVEWTYTGADWSIAILSSLTGPAGKGVQEAWDISKHAARAFGRTMVDGQWHENMTRSGQEYLVEQLWGAAFGELSTKMGAPGAQMPDAIGDQFSRIKIQNLVPSNMSDAGWSHIAQGMHKFITDQGLNYYGRDPLKNLTGAFDWSPPWPNLP